MDFVAGGRGAAGAADLTAGCPDFGLADLAAGRPSVGVVDLTAGRGSPGSPAPDREPPAVAPFLAAVRRDVVDSRTPESDPVELRAGTLALTCFRALELAAATRSLPAFGAGSGPPATPELGAATRSAARRPDAAMWSPVDRSSAAA